MGRRLSNVITDLNNLRVQEGYETAETESRSLLLRIISELSPTPENIMLFWAIYTEYYDFRYYARKIGEFCRVRQLNAVKFALTKNTHKFDVRRDATASVEIFYQDFIYPNGTLSERSILHDIILEGPIIDNHIEFLSAVGTVVKTLAETGRAPLGWAFDRNIPLL